MAVPVIVECCYTCSNCLVGKQICQLKRTEIANIHRDKCERYTLRKMWKCLMCGGYVINLAQHVNQEHGINMMNYNVITREVDSKQTVIRRKNIWE